MMMMKKVASSLVSLVSKTWLEANSQASTHYPLARLVLATTALLVKFKTNKKNIHGFWSVMVSFNIGGTVVR